MTNPQMKSRQWALDFYKSFEWRSVRFDILKRDGSRCCLCGATPNDGSRMNVDHIRPLRKYPDLALDPKNLQVLCGSCNHGKANKEPRDIVESFIFSMPARDREILKDLVLFVQVDCMVHPEEIEASIHDALVDESCNRDKLISVIAAIASDIYSAGIDRGVQIERRGGQTVS